jgi:hypothetical protein
LIVQKKGGNILLVIRTVNFLKGLSVYRQTRNFEDLLETIKGILKTFGFFLLIEFFFFVFEDKIKGFSLINFNI